MTKKYDLDLIVETWIKELKTTEISEIFKRLYPNGNIEEISKAKRQYIMEMITQQLTMINIVIGYDLGYFPKNSNSWKIATMIKNGAKIDEVQDEIINIILNEEDEDETEDKESELYN